MTTAKLFLQGPFGLLPRSRKPLPGWMWAAGIAMIAAILLVFLWRGETISQRPHDMKTTRVILPPPPPPPPPEPIEQDKTPEPTEALAIEEPVDSPPPPEQASSDPTPGDNALTAREGAGPSNYGLAQGDGSGTRIGSRPGGDNGFAAYAGVARNAIQVAAQSDRELARGRYTVQLMVAVNAEGRITDVRVMNSSGDTRRDERLRQVLTGLQLSRRPPAGLPAMRIELNARSSA